MGSFLQKLTILLVCTFIFLLTPFASAKDKGEIQIRCQPKIRVFLDKRYMGKSNEIDSGYCLKNLRYGNYKIKLSDGKISEEFPVYLTDPRLVVLSKKFARTDETLEPNIEMKDYNVVSIIKDKEQGKTVLEHPYDKVEYKRIMALLADTIIIDADQNYLMKSIQGNSPPKIIKEVFPLSSKELRGQIDDLIFLVEALINTEGDVVEIKVIEKSNFPEFDESVKVALFKNKFIPAVVNNKRVSVWRRFKYEDLN